MMGHGAKSRRVGICMRAEAATLGLAIERLQSVGEVEVNLHDDHKISNLGCAHLSPILRKVGSRSSTDFDLWM
jgi:hypothetical protein